MNYAATVSITSYEAMGWLRAAVGIALIAAGIKMIDLIHPLPSGSNDSVAYRYWHTQQDTADKCSPKTLKIVGDVVTDVLYREPK